MKKILFIISMLLVLLYTSASFAAFSSSGFRLIGKSESGGQNLYAYTSPDLKATILTSTYFNNVAPYSLKEGDIIFITIDNDGTIDTTTVVVSDITSGAVTVSESSSVTPAGKVYLTVSIADISTAGSYWVVSPVAGTVTKIYSVIRGAIATADAGLSFEIGGTAITDGGITVAYSGSAAGDVDSSTPTALNTVTAGQAIECITDGASTNTIIATITLEITT